MDSEAKEIELYPVWVDWEHRIISFHKEVGFEKLEYASYDEKMDFAIEKIRAGFHAQ